MSETFEVEQIDMLGSRASRDRGIGAEFPQRVETNTDLNYYDRARKVDTKIQFGSPSSTIYEVKRRFNEDELERLVTNNAYFGAVKKAIERNANRRQNCTRMLAVSFKENTRMTPKLSERLIALQEKFEVVGIYDGYNLTSSALKESIGISQKVMNELGMSPQRVNVRIPTLIQRPELLKDKMSISFAETDGVALKHAAITRALKQYRVIRAFNEKGKWTHMYDMANVWTGNDRTSLMHIIQLYGIDSFGLRTRKPPKNILPITPKRLDIGSLGTLTIQEHTQRYGHDLSCPCPICVNKTMDDMQNDYSPYERYPIFRSHLPYASNIEFALDRDAMLNGGKHLLNMLRSKEFMAEPFRAVYNDDINSRSFQPRLF
jgi:hypothetical protein